MLFLSKHAAVLPLRPAIPPASAGLAVRLAIKPDGHGPGGRQPRPPSSRLYRSAHESDIVCAELGHLMQHTYRALPFVAVVVCAGFVFGRPIQAAQTRPVKLYIGAATQGRFVNIDKSVQDSIKDITGKLRDTKGLLVVVPKREDADLVLVIAARGQGSEPYGQRLSLQETYRGAEVVNMPISLNTWWVSTLLEVPTADYRREFLGTYTHPPGLDYYGGAWTECASRIAKDLKTWVEANKTEVLAGR